MSTKARTHASPRLRVQKICTGGRTKPEFKKDCDINLIMKKHYQNDIHRVPFDAGALRYGDFSQIPDFMEMQHRVIAAHEMFDALPAEVRKQFDNDPGKFIAAAQTPDGVKLLQKLGLRDPEEPKEPLKEAPKAGVETKVETKNEAPPSEPVKK